MLNNVRKPSRAKGILAYIVFGAIIIVFIGFGNTQSRIGNDPHGVAAVVNRSQISLADFRDRVQALERQYQSRIEQIPAGQKTEFTKAIKQRAMEDLIQFEVMVQEAAERGVRVPDEEVRDAIVQIPAFQEEGRFKRDYYDRFLKDRQWNAGQFEGKIRKDLVMRKVQVLFQEALKPTGAEKTKDQAVGSTKINLDVATFSDDELKSKIPVTEAEIKAWLAVKDNADKVKKIYDDNTMAYAEPEQVKARHILLTVDKSKPESDAEAKKKIEALAARAKTEDFSKLAKENSQDTSNASKGGDLGTFGRGRMVPEFETAAFATEVGKVSAPVKTDFGYHLIKVEGKNPARTRPFDDVKMELARGEVAAGKIADTTKSLEAKVAAGDEAGARKAAKDLGLQFGETGPFTLDTAQVPQLADADKVLEEILKRKITKGLLPELIKAKGQNYIIVVKSFSTDTKAEDNLMSEYVGSRKFYDAFAGWAKAAMAKANIQRNNAVVVN